MFIDYVKFFTKSRLFLLTLMVDSDGGESMPEVEKVQKKIKLRKNRDAPIFKFIILLAAIILTLVVLEYFI